MKVINLFMISKMNYFFLKLVYIRNIEFVNGKKINHEIEKVRLHIIFCIIFISILNYHKNRIQIVL